MSIFTKPNRSTKFLAQGICLLLFVLSSFMIHAQVQLNTSRSPVSVEGTTTVEVTAQNFSDVVAMQFTMNWDPSVLEFVGFSTVAVDSIGALNLNESNINTGFAEQGELPVAWLSPAVQPVNVPDGTILFLIHFNVLSNVPSEIYFDSTPTPIEFISVTGDSLWFTSTSNQVETNSRLVQGKVFLDANNDCTLQENEEGLQQWTVELQAGERSVYLRSNKEGQFNAYLSPGTYTYRLIRPDNNYWNVCELEQSFTILEEGGGVKELLFAAQPIIDCPAMTVNVSTPFLRRCFENYYFIEYCNQGTAIAEDAYVLLELPPELTIMSSPLDYSLVEGNTYRFDIGNAPLNSCSGFALSLLLDCESTDLGETHCVRANVFPNEVCEVDQLWSGASLDIKSSCEGDSVRFDIENKGEGNMGEAEEYIVIQDMIMLRQSTIPVQLNSGEAKVVKLPANGATYRLEMKQVPFHPTIEQISAAIEGCGVSEQGTVSRGFINQFERSDESPFTDEDCQENIGAFDPNDKAGYPNGYGPKHFVDQNQKLTYHIRFQNTGTDTAFNIVVLDTLSEFLDVSTFQPLAASHEYEVVVQKENILKYSFKNILLVDSVKNEPLSHGFIRFSMEQKVDVPLGTVINNSAAIYFDFNKPVITNITEHTVGKDYIEQAVVTSLFELPEMEMTLSPNPFSYTTLVQFQEEDIQQGRFLLYDMRGRLMQEYDFNGNQFHLSRNELSAGVYLYKVMAEDQPLGRGKLVIQD